MKYETVTGAKALLSCGHWREQLPGSGRPSIASSKRLECWACLQAEWDAEQKLENPS